MGFWRMLFGRRESPEETIRLTRRVMDLLAEGKSDEDVQRALFREGVPVDRAAAIVSEVQKARIRHRGSS
jgi:hypothetical protein